MDRCFIALKAIIGGFLLLFCLIFITGAVFAEKIVYGVPLSSLEQIEPLINNGPEISASLSAVARDESLKMFETKRTGVKYFSGVTFGHSNEPIFDTSDSKNQYNKLTLTSGLNFPMLGTLQKEKIGKLEAEKVLIKSRYQNNMLLLNNLVALRKAYTTLWIEQQKEEVAKRFLDTEAETIHILQERQAQGLVLPSDRLDLLSVYFDIKRDIAASKLRQTQALGVIYLITGYKWNMVEKLRAPSFPYIDGEKINLDIHPEVTFQNNLVSQYEKIYAEKKQISRDASFTVGITTARDFPGTTGTGAYMAFSLTDSVKGNASKDQGRLAALNDLNRAKGEEIFTRLKLEGQVEEALATAAYAASDVNARASRLIVMAETIREKMLRRLVLPGDTFEQLQQSKSLYYRTALEMLEREEMLVYSLIDIISYVYPKGLESESAERFFPIDENDAMRNNLLAPKWLDAKNIQNNISISAPLNFTDIPSLKYPIITFVSPKETPSNPVEKNTANSLEKIKTAVYVWNAQPFLQSDTRTDALNKIIDAGFSRILISFTNKQISNLITPEGKDELDALIVAAKRNRVRIDLLLGEPTWAEANHRGELLALIRQLEKFDFDGIHLDIEPDSLPNGALRRGELLEGLADTVKSVMEITSLPVSLSIHPRYLEDNLGAIARQKLLPLGLEEVVVMIYSNNPRSTAQRMSAIMTSNPNIPFSLAQSIEKNISPAESYANFNRQEFEDSINVLEKNLAGYGLKAIFIQAWEDYDKGEK